VQVEAEEFAELSLKYEVIAVPTFILFKVGCHRKYMYSVPYM